MNELYRFFYPDKFKPKNSYAPVDYAYVHRELSKVGARKFSYGKNTVKNVRKKVYPLLLSYIFVATFPYSQYTYVEAAASMNQFDWLYCNVHMLEFFEGSPVKTVCDNLKTGVITHPKHGEIVLNDAYLSFA